MAGSPRSLLCLCLGWSCLGLALGDLLRAHLAGLRRRARAAGAEGPALPPGDKVSEHMLRLYGKYSGAAHELPGLQPPPLREGNTVRSFRARPAGSPGSKEPYVFNLTSLTKSENILSASLHYYIGDLINATWSCPRSRGCSRHGHRKPEVQIDLSVLSFPSDGNRTRILGHFLINISTAYRDILSWQWKDITRVLSEAKQNDELLIGVKMASTSHYSWRRMPPSYEPYILVYANDSAISEPESVVFSLQGPRNSLVEGFPSQDSHLKRRLGEQRQKRSTNILLPLQNNELPGAEYQYNEDEGWEDRKPYKTLQPRLAERTKSKKKQRKNNHQKSQTLQFDEQTLKKARRRQWNEPRYCARRYLKVDFADIGWSEWIISPKSFDAYYCSGECQFPIPKALKPSNHATIQSIVRAVGVIPGIPEPCCVPDKMSSLSILFFDENKNVVLKVYPNMTVESCACR
uniref:Bone morphogenetic protein 3 n=1 Tax=Pelusios castaneus TaxID=367368 RepID=A0A8C8RK95_9SAUR